MVLVILILGHQKFLRDPFPCFAIIFRALGPLGDGQFHLLEIIVLGQQSLEFFT